MRPSLNRNTQVGAEWASMDREGVYRLARRRATSGQPWCGTIGRRATPRHDVVVGTAEVDTNRLQLFGILPASLTSQLTRGFLEKANVHSHSRSRNRNLILLFSALTILQSSDIGPARLSGGCSRRLR